ncbi:FMN-binding protein [Shewanella cyperi]|uniref:FMN-binding protein n=1 Tax=Shewanella cyperi TaxID=2814292 RepID=A0A974XNN3_9GAMM|nr:FMN-binding protein [Shewanella cyperi]QSX31747.1 FMN-binding protein [Shewanella cyperi]QSX42519.1 FMN-binding protein [Shewanella cyperi]
MKPLLLLLSLLFMVSTQADEIYQSNDDFIRQSLGELPKAQVLWLSDKQKSDIEEILAHKFNKFRVRYWAKPSQSVWILEEIGKESPITVGIHVDQGHIVRTKVLVYRESRGDEVRHDFFTDQFKSATLTDNLQLDKTIDGITGATLSVRALTKLSRIALYLDAALQPQEAQVSQ